MRSEGKVGILTGRRVGWTAVLLAVAVGSAVAHEQFVMRMDIGGSSYYGGPVVWPNADGTGPFDDATPAVPIVCNADKMPVSKGWTEALFVDFCQEQIDRWEAVPHTRIRMAIDGVVNDSSLKSDTDGINIIGWDNTIWCYNGSACVYRIQPQWNGWTWMVEADCYLNPDPVGYDVSPDSGQLRNFLTHELGHAVGLEHSFVEDTFSAYVSGGHSSEYRSAVMGYGSDQTNPELTPDDIASVSLHYPAASDPIEGASGTVEGVLYHADGVTPVIGGQVFAVNVETGQMTVGRISSYADLVADGKLKVLPEPSRTGRFRIRGLPTGTYDLYAISLATFHARSGVRYEAAFEDFISTRVSGIGISAGQTLQRDLVAGTTEVSGQASMDLSAVGLTVDADGSVSSSPNGAIVSWVWDMGDGTVLSGETASHTYAVCGRYTVSLTVTDEIGESWQAVRDVAALAPFGTVPGNDGWVDFDSADSCANDPSLTYVWNFGDGTSDTGVLVEHPFDSGGFTVTLQATNGSTSLGSISAVPYIWTYVKTPDFDQNATINIIDILAMKPVFGTTAGDGIYEEKYDLNSDGTINIIDILAMKPVFGGPFHTRFPIPGW